MEVYTRTFTRVISSSLGVHTLKFVKIDQGLMALFMNTKLLIRMYSCSKHRHILLLSHVILSSMGFHIKFRENRVRIYGTFQEDQTTYSHVLLLWMEVYSRTLTYIIPSSLDTYTANFVKIEQRLMAFHLKTKLLICMYCSSK
jgi:hypothetical protein